MPDFPYARARNWVNRSEGYDPATDPSADAAWFEAVEEFLHATSDELRAGTGGGAATAFSAEGSPGGAVGASSFVNVVIGTEVYDLDGSYDPATGLFVAPAAGRYRFTGALWVSGSGGSAFLRLKLTRNDAIARILDMRYADASNGTVLSGSAALNLAQGDRVGLQVENTGTSFDASVSGTGTDRFEGERIA